MLWTKFFSFLNNFKYCDTYNNLLVYKRIVLNTTCLAQSQCFYITTIYYKYTEHTKID